MEKYVTKREKFAFAFAAMGSYMIAGFANGYLTIFFTDLLIVTPSLVFGLMLFARVWDMVNDPIMGIIVDKTNTKYGKMAPYVFIGAIAHVYLYDTFILPIYKAAPLTKMIYAAIMYICYGMAYTR